MKTLFVIVVAFYYSFLPSQAQTKGIVFQQGTWKEALKKAHDEGKLLFVDTYTTWCGPCKLLERDVFSDAKVGETFNTQFINVRIDAEKGEGIELAKAYRVSAYPTMLFVNSTGQLVHEIIGLIKTDKLIGEGGIALSKRTGSLGLTFKGAQREKSLADWNKEFPLHKNDTSFLYNYIRIRHQNNVLDGNKLLDEYIALLPQKEQHSTKSLLLMSQCLETFDTRAGQVFARYIAEANLLEDQGYSMGRTFGFARATFSKAVAKRDTSILNAYNRIIPVLNKMYAAYTIQDQQDSLALVQANRLRYLKETGDTAAYLRTIPTYVESYLLSLTPERLSQKDNQTLSWFMRPYLTGKEDSTQVPGFADMKRGLHKNRTRAIADQLNTFAADFSAMHAAEGELSPALEWTQQAQQLFYKTDYVLTEANLLKKANRPSEARTVLERGIQDAQKRQVDYQALTTALTSFK
ncbi:hypothetical protein GCM10028818_55920 [Spirosoma horti]